MMTIQTQVNNNRQASWQLKLFFCARWCAKTMETVKIDKSKIGINCRGTILMMVDTQTIYLFLAQGELTRL